MGGGSPPGKEPGADEGPRSRPINPLRETHMRFGNILTATAFLLIATSASAAGLKPVTDNPEVNARPDGKGGVLLDLAKNSSGKDSGVIDTAKPGGGGGGSNGISYHGGPVMTGTKHIYYIWYGNWSGNS